MFLSVGSSVVVPLFSITTLAAGAKRCTRTSVDNSVVVPLFSGASLAAEAKSYKTRQETPKYLKFTLIPPSLQTVARKDTLQLIHYSSESPKGIV